MVDQARGGQRWRWRGEIRRDMHMNGEGTPDPPIPASTAGQRGRGDNSVVSPDCGPQDVAIEFDRSDLSVNAFNEVDKKGSTMT